MKKKKEKIKVFISYSHVDEKFMKQLETHLALLKRNGYIKIWHDRRISPGQQWQEEISDNLDSSNLILFLVSPDLLASEYCYGIELNRALEMQREGLAQIIPIIIRPVLWEISPFSKFHPLPKDGRPITLWENIDEAYLDVAKGLLEAIKKLPDSSDKDSMNQALAAAYPTAETSLPEKTVSYVITFNYDIKKLTKEKKDEILAKLRALTPGSEIQLLEIKEGSIVFVLQSGERSFETINSLSKRNEISEILGLEVSKVVLLPDTYEEFETELRKIEKGLNVSREHIKTSSKCTFDSNLSCSLSMNLLLLLAELVRLNESVSRDINFLLTITAIERLIGNIIETYNRYDINNRKKDKSIKCSIFVLHQCIEDLISVVNTSSGSDSLIEKSSIHNIEAYLAQICSSWDKEEMQRLMKGFESLLKVRDKIIHIEHNTIDFDLKLLDEEFIRKLSDIKWLLSPISTILKHRVNKLLEAPYVVKDYISQTDRSLSVSIDKAISMLPHYTMSTLKIWPDEIFGEKDK